MKKGYLNLIIVQVFFITSIFFSNFVLSSLNILFQIVYWLIAFIILKFLSGFEKDKSIIKKDMLQSIFIYSFLYIFLEYFVGLFTGFLRSPYNHDLIHIIRNVVSMFLVIGLEELSRYIIISKGKDNILVPILSIILFSIFDLFVGFKIYDITQKEGIFNLIVLLLLPSISKNILLTYVTYKGGYKPAILYRSILELIPFLVPIFADLGDYVNSVFQIVVPFIILYRLVTLYSKREKVDIRKEEATRRKATIRLICISLVLWILVYLVSGFFRYYLVVVATGSMIPAIEVGDGVIVEQIDKNYKKIKKDEILAFRQDKKMIVHRVVAIKKIGNEYIFRTKGDNNENIDNWIVHEEDVVGIVKLKIKYIGIPTVYFNKYLNK